MWSVAPLKSVWIVGGIGTLLMGCQPTDQSLPFDLLEGPGATTTIGPSGGTLSVPPSFSLVFPAGSLPTSTSVGVLPRTSGPFPADAGPALPGSAFDVGPGGTVLAAPAQVEIAVDTALLAGEGDDVRLAVAVQRQTGAVSTFDGVLDLTNGVLRAEIDELGPMAAVVSLDAIPIETDAPPTLGGGTFPQPAPAAPGGLELAPQFGGIEFAAECAPAQRQCFSSGLIRLWADEVVRQRLGDDLWFLNPSVSASLEFIGFDGSGVPTQIAGSVSIEGDVRARFNSAVTSVDLEDGASTGPGQAVVPTTLAVSGNVLIVGQTTTTDGEPEFDEEFQFGVTGIGTTQMMTIRVEADLEFDNADGSVEVGTIIGHLRLRVPES